METHDLVSPLLLCAGAAGFSFSAKMVSRGFDHPNTPSVLLPQAFVFGKHVHARI